MSSAPEIVPWEVPFASSVDPSVGIITENLGETITLVVAPLGIDKYPKYIVRFDRVITSLCYEEACAFDRGYGYPGKQDGSCAYRWLGSEWLQGYQKGVDLFGWKDLGHYLIFGGDSIVEVIACGTPDIKWLDAKTTITTIHEV